MALKLALIGSSTALICYTTYRYMSRPNPSIFTEKPFYEEALALTRGYKPINDKLVEPIKPLQVDTSNKFNVLTLLGAQFQVQLKGTQRSGIVYCYASRESLDDDWHVDKLEFKANNQPNRFLFYDRSLRRVPTPTEQALIDYRKEIESKNANQSTSSPSTAVAAVS